MIRYLPMNAATIASHAFWLAMVVGPCQILLKGAWSSPFIVTGIDKTRNTHLALAPSTHNANAKVSPQTIDVARIQAVKFENGNEIRFVTCSIGIADPKELEQIWMRNHPHTVTELMIA